MSPKSSNACRFFLGDRADFIGTEKSRSVTSIAGQNTGGFFFVCVCVVFFVVVVALRCWQVLVPGEALWLM